jgi:hypothetical protein
VTLHDWMVYAALISAVSAGTAWSLGGMLRVFGRQSRWVWLAALMLSVVVPGTALVFDSEGPVSRTAPAQAPEVPLRSTTGLLATTAIVFRTADTALGDAQLRLARGVVRGGDILSALPTDEASIKRAWAAASLALVLVLAFAFGRIWVAARSWERGTVLGREVWISRATGPASIGIFHPRVVLPEWAAKLDARELALVLSHEDEHSRVRDPMLLALAWLPVVAMPWNPFLWWQFRCLASAVEVDCDRRVLRKGVSRRSYLALLIRLAARARGDRGPLPSGVRFASPLRTRMEAMIGRSRSLHLAFPAALVLGLSFAAVACGPRVPAAIRESTRPPQYDPVRVFRNSQTFVIGDFVTALDAGARVISRAAEPRDAVQSSTRRQDGTVWIPIQAAQDTTNARPCEYWRVGPDGQTVTGPGYVRLDRCVPRESTGRAMLVVGPMPANAPPCEYWEVLSPDSVIVLQGVVANGRCGPRERMVIFEIPPGVP